jgi:hypothetical protein
MEVDLKKLRSLLDSSPEAIENIVSGTGYLPKTVIGVATFLLDNEGNLDLLTAKQLNTYERFIKPLLDAAQK